MSGVWESLFREEKQDWTSCIVSTVTNTINFILEVPCLILALLSTTIIFTWEFIVAQARVVSDFLHLDEWWGIEHSIFSIFMTINLFFFLRRRRGDWYETFCQTNSMLQALGTLGCFMWMASGLQGGVVFGGKLFFPTWALFSMALQIVRMYLNITEKELYGYGLVKEKADAKNARITSYFGQSLCFSMAFLTSIATFGIPSFEGDLLPWVSVFPGLAMFHKSFGYFEPEARQAASAITEITDNGNATKIQEEPEKVEESAEAPKPEAEESTKEETKPEETKSDETPKDEEAKKEPEVVKPAPEPVKPSALCLACEGLLRLVCATICKVKSCVVNVIDRVLALPWESIFTLTTSVGTSLAVTLAYWSLTEDYAVLIMPAVCHFLPYVASKAQAKGWLSERGSNLSVELSQLAASASQYYLFRTYISLPFWGEADLQTMTLTETSSFPISAEDGRNGAIVLVSALSLLTGVSPVSF